MKKILISLLALIILVKTVIAVDPEIAGDVAGISDHCYSTSTMSSSCSDAFGGGQWKGWKDGGNGNYDSRTVGHTWTGSVVPTSIQIGHSQYPPLWNVNSASFRCSKNTTDGIDGDWDYLMDAQSIPYVPYEYIFEDNEEDYISCKLANVWSGHADYIGMYYLSIRGCWGAGCNGGGGGGGNPPYSGGGYYNHYKRADSITLGVDF